MKKLKIALQMDDISSIKFDKDSTFLLGMEAQKRGYELYYYQPKDLLMQDGLVMAYMNKISLYNDRNNYFKLEPLIKEDLSSMDVILIRQDPPVDMAYLTYCHMLERLQGKNLIINDPRSLRDLPEKLFICAFPDITPPTLVTQNIEAIKDFQKQYIDIVVKPIYSYSGCDVFLIKENDENFDVIIASLIKTYNQPLIIQKFMKEVRQGEKRIFLIDGVPVAAIKKIPASNEIRSNLSAGSSVVSYKLSASDIEICSKVGEYLKKNNIIFAGIDIIEDYITEINITSPTLIPAVNKLDNICLESMIWDKIEERLSYIAPASA
ncbi:Glutathione synthetase [Candidatus Arcanobacter lacustris]|uniref:Glutathione synthetase n=1 Tax=Candidatus Arcanibacter lacustris TaxID=1607817 RepID=A0A0F5MPP2_9RICK|nr:Glutathione synthetase [Candidatus Arcanobacter lacustris]